MQKQKTRIRIIFLLQGALTTFAGFFAFFASLFMIEWWLNHAMSAVGVGTLYIPSPILSVLLKSAGALLFLWAWLSFTALRNPRLQRPLAHASMFCWTMIFLGTLWNMRIPYVRSEIPLFLFAFRMGTALAFVALFWLFAPKAEEA